MSSSPNVIVQAFDKYATSQLKFAKNVSELASKSSYVECLISNDVVECVMPLAINTNPTVRMNAVLALARLAGNSELCVQQMLCSKNILNQIFGRVTKENKYYKQNCTNLIKNLCKYSSASLEVVIKECEGINAILTCMKDSDALVKEGAMQVITSIARQNTHLLQLFVTSGALIHIVQCLKEEEQNLKLYALSTLDEIVKDNEEFAIAVVEVPSLLFVINFLSPNFTDVKIKKNALVLIKDIVKHSLFLAECAIGSNLFPDIFLLTKQPDECVRNNVANVIQELVKHSVQIAQVVVANGGLASLLNVMLCRKEYSPISAVLALGYIGAMSPSLASAVIESQAPAHLADILKSGYADKYSKAGAVWALGVMGRHGPEHARRICAGDAVTAMTDIYRDPNLDSESREKCRRALLRILNGCDDYFDLEKLLKPSIPSDIFSYVLDKISKILPNNSRARRSFNVNGHLKMIQSLRPEIDSDLYQVIQSVNSCYSEDELQMLTKDSPKTVVNTVARHTPQSQCLFYDNYLRSEELLSTSSMSEEIYSSDDELLFE